MSSDDGEPTEYGKIVATGWWLHEAALSLRQYVAGDRERAVDLRWLVLGLEAGSNHLLQIGMERKARSPGNEFIAGQRSRH